MSYQNRYGAFFAPVTLGLLAEALGAVGQVDEALDVIDHAIENAQHSRQNWNDAELYRLKGTLQLRDDNNKTEQAEQNFERALAIARQQQAKWLELRAAISLARLWGCEGKVAEPRELVAPIYHWFTEGFETRDLTDAKALLEQFG